MKARKNILLLLATLLSTQLYAELVLENLNIDVDLATYIGNTDTADDNRLFIAEQRGKIKIYDNGILLPVPFLDISSLSNTGYERGLLSFAFHPNYHANGFVFVYYTNLGNYSTVARYKVSDANPNQIDTSTSTIIYSLNSGTGHYGGQLGFGADGYLYLSIGDGGTQGDPECDAQDHNNTLGTILRLNIDQNINTPPYYGIPNDNPFDGSNDTPDAEVWVFGFRNPWRFSFDRLTDDMYISDVGQNAREEVNIKKSGTSGGNNYGWKAMEGTYCYDSNIPPNNCPIATPSCGSLELTAPAIEYDHNNGDCSITGGYVYRGNFASQLWGGYLYGDWCTGNIWSSINIDGVRSSQLLQVSLQHITTFGEDSNGEVYLSDGDDVYLIKNDDLIFVNGFE